MAVRIDEIVKVRIDEIVKVRIEDFGTSGEGIGRHHGLTVFVPDAVPGDDVEVEITHVEKRFVRAKLRRILTASPDRVDPVCAVFGSCGGCQLQHISYEAQLIYKQKRVQDTLKRLAKLDFSVSKIMPSIQAFGYRNKAQFPVSCTRNNDIKLGFFARNSHELVDVETCPIQLPELDSVYKQIRTLIKALKIDVYCEKTRKGLLRHVVLRHMLEGVYVTFVINASSTVGLKTLLSRLQADPHPLIVGISVNFNVASTNVIMGSCSEAVLGDGVLIQELEGICYELSDTSFFQVNSGGAAELIKLVSKYAAVQSFETVLDCYCGVGTFALALGKKAKHCFGIESWPEAVEFARKNAELNHIPAIFYCGDVAQQLQNWQEKVDVLVLDPPRKGCDPLVLEQVLRIRPSKLIYVSCDPATLARDLKVLVEGGYGVCEVQPVDLFPQTVHVETVVRLEIQ